MSSEVYQFDSNSVRPLVEAGLISVQLHPTKDLWIYNYTARAQYSREWNLHTLNCRGLIVDADDVIVARPFPKFFNVEELPRSDIIFSKPFTVTEKLDGSLGILYGHTRGYLLEDMAIATRGSFASDQALKATEILKTKYVGTNLFFPMIHYTYLFEIIYPENRIVVDYGDTEDLMLLAVRETHTGIEVPVNEENRYGWPGPIVTTFAADLKAKGFHKQNWIKQFGLVEDGTQEGLVFAFNNQGHTVRAKMKLDEYKRLHRLVTQVTTKTIWESLKAGDSFDELLDKVPDEFYGWVKGTIADLNQRFRNIEASARNDMITAQRVWGNDRKAIAKFLNEDDNCMFPGVTFAMLDGKDYDDMIWKIVKPKFEKPFLSAAEKESDS